MGINWDNIDWKKFERIVAKLHRDKDCKVEHNVTRKGKSGDPYQIDVLITFEKKLSRFVWIVSCKHWKDKVGRPVVGEFSSVIEDVGASKGTIVSKEGFTEDAVKLARQKNIELLMLRDLKEEDWEGRVKTIVVKPTLVIPKIERVQLLFDRQEKSLPVGQEPSITRDKAFLYDEHGQVVGNILDMLNQEAHKDTFSAPERREETVTFQETRYVIINKRKIKLNRVKFSVCICRSTEEIRIEGDPVIGAVLENMLTKEKDLLCQKELNMSNPDGDALSEDA